MGPDGPKWGQEDLFPANPDLADILGDTNFDFENFHFFLDFLGPKFLAWAQLGPTHLGPAWAHPLGPGVGPPTWAWRGPTHARPSLGPPSWAQTPPAPPAPAAPDEFSNPDPGPSQRTQG